ncbi:MAG: hypothetical protein IRZ13_18320 [Acetobacteraceae bacterium]|nr:hypothetical protein [Acetobacteraceae bacterium]
MTESARRDAPPPDSLSRQEAALQRVVEAARRLVAMRDQAAALSAQAPPPPLTFAEGVERDLLAFRLEHAACELREALRALDAGAGAPPAAPSRP